MPVLGMRVVVLRGLAWILKRTEKGREWYPTHRPPDARAPLINGRRGAEGDKLTPNVTKNVTVREVIRDR